MSDIIRIKRRASGGAAGAPASLKTTELAYNEVDDIMYIGFGDDGSGNATSIRAVAGFGAAVGITGNQTIGGTKTFSNDVIVPGEVYGAGWNGSNEVPTKNDVYDQMESISAAGVSDGDKGDITVSASGGTWTIDNDTVSNAKLANMATKTYKGRTSGTTGDPEDVSVATLKADLALDNVTNESKATMFTNAALTGNPTAPTATPGDNDTTIATTAFVVAEIAARLATGDFAHYAGAIDASGNPNYPAGNAGDTYRISVAGKIGGASGPNVQAGDILMLHVDGSAGGTHAAVGSDWDIIQNNIDGALTTSDIGVSVQAYNAKLAAFSGLTGAADKGIQFTGVSSMATFDLTAAGKALLDDADNTAQRSTLGLGTMATQNAGAVAITGGTIDGVTIDGGTF